MPTVGKHYMLVGHGMWTTLHVGEMIRILSKEEYELDNPNFISRNAESGRSTFYVLEICHNERFLWSPFLDVFWDQFVCEKHFLPRPL